MFKETNDQYNKNEFYIINGMVHKLGKKIGFAFIKTRNDSEYQK